MYAVTPCSNCRRLRIIDLKTISSNCPSCGSACEHARAEVLYQSDKQSDAREALGHYSGFVPEKKDNREKIAEADPHSTLVYRYEHGATQEEKMEILAKGLTSLYKTFTVEDVRSVEPKNPEKLLAAMHDAGFVAEVSHGRFKG